MTRTETTSTYWVSIGRNAGGDPLTLSDWHSFHSDVRSTLFESSATIISTVHGTSEWEGVAEDTVLILASIPTANLPAVRNLLGQLATYWRQDAIGFVGGPGSDTLVTGTTSDLG